MKDWRLRAAKRIVAELALQEAIKAIGATKDGGGPLTATSYGESRFLVAMHLARHAAEQLRLSEQP